ncbi:hypothetical protein [Streptomyces sp. NPDC059788]|uniref:hypothetical protein n=1 Tax=Streptomyces sp. NPDC059788 TaxID=3346948 RepID=UPI00365FAC3D
MPETKKFKIHLSLEFGMPTEALDWFDGLRRSEALLAEAEPYFPDVLDKERHGYTAHDLLVRRQVDRPYGRVRDRGRL